MSHNSTTLSAPDVVTLLSASTVPVVTNRLTDVVDVTLEVPHGISGSLYHAMWDRAEVAVRVIRLNVPPNNASYQMLKLAADELKVWLRLKHDYVLPLLGLACIQGQSTLVTPWIHNGRIIQFLHKHPSANRFNMCVQLASAVAYLHSKGVVHQNIKADNLLVSHNRDVKLVGFGTWTLKRIQHHGDALHESEMRLRWTAPEIYNGGSSYTTATDVWALGMTILEIYTGLHPYATCRTDRDAMTKVIARAIPSRPHQFDGYDQLWALLVHCWAFDPRNRPSAAVVYEAVRKMV